MESINQIKKLEINGDIAGAAAMYIAVVDYKSLNTSELLDAAVLLALTQDYGYATAHNIPENVRDVAWDKSRQMLLSIAPDSREVEAERNFWLLYLDYVFMGGPPFEAEALQLLQYSKLPITYVLQFDSNDNYKAVARKLKEEAATGATKRQKFILSLIKD